jgi:hypothetical protein
MPLAVTESFATLIGAVEGSVELATQPILERLRTWLKDQLPEVIHAIDSESRAADLRRRMPRFTSAWRIEQPYEPSLGRIR